MPRSEAETEQAIGWLAKIRFCQGLDRDQLVSLAQELTERSFAAGETIASPDDPVTEFWIVVEGELDSFLTDPRGREEFLGVVNQAETVGEIFILEKNPNRPARFTARTNGKLLVAPAEALIRWVKNYPSLIQNLFFTLSERSWKASTFPSFHDQFCAMAWRSSMEVCSTIFLLMCWPKKVLISL